MYSLLDSDCMGVVGPTPIGAAALIDGHGDATLAVGGGGDGHQRDSVRDPGARGVREDLLNDRSHNRLVIAAPTRGKEEVTQQRSGRGTENKDFPDQLNLPLLP